MNFKQYQKEAKKFDLHDSFDFSKPNDICFMEKFMGLSEETGELMGKMKRVFRQKEDKISVEKVEEISAEMGDILWYLTLIAEYLGLEIEDIAKQNIEKLDDRKSRNKIEGSGDKR